MSKWQTLQKLVTLLAKEPHRLKRIIDPEEEKKAYLSEKYGFTSLKTVDLLHVVPNLNERVFNYSYLDGTSLVTDIALLRALARRFAACIYFEIGSFRGESISNVSEIAETCYSLTLSKEEMRAMGIREEFIAMHGIYSKGIKNIRSFYHNSFTFDFDQLDTPFDLIFVDGDHTYEGVKTDTAHVVPLRRDEQSIIVWHDYGHTVEKVRHSVLAGILDGLPPDLHHRLYHVSNTKCAILLPEAPELGHLSDPARPNKAFSLQISGTFQ